MRDGDGFRGAAVVAWGDGVTSALPATVAIPETVMWQQVGDEVVILDVEGGEYHSLNDVGSQMWKALDECPDVTAAYERLRETYEVDPATLRTDLETFITRLIEMGLLSAT